MAESAHIDMSISDLLAWAWAETRMADALEGSSMEFAILIGTDVAETIATHRARSRWLDEVVAQRLDDRDKKEDK